MYWYGEWRWWMDDENGEEQVMWHLCYGNVAWGAILAWRYEYARQRWVWSLWIWHHGAWVPIHLVDLQYGDDDNDEDNGDEYGSDGSAEDADYGSDGEILHCFT